MKRFLCALALCCAALPAVAADDIQVYCRETGGRLVFDVTPDAGETPTLFHPILFRVSKASFQDLDSESKAGHWKQVLHTLNELKQGSHKTVYICD